MINLYLTRGLFLLALMFLVGCTPPGPQLFPVRGAVTLDGKPLAEGNVYFRLPETGEFATFPVKDGAFEGKSQAGEQRVEVVAYRTIPVAGEMGGEVQESLIATRFNSDSKLTATVTAAGPNEFKFEVEGK